MRTWDDEARDILNEIYEVIDFIENYDYADVASLSREANSIANKMKWTILLYRKLANLGGKYSGLLYEFADERSTLVREIKQAVSDLWDKWREARYERFNYLG